MVPLVRRHRLLGGCLCKSKSRMAGRRQRHRSEDQLLVERRAFRPSSKLSRQPRGWFATSDSHVLTSKTLRKREETGVQQVSASQRAKTVRRRHVSHAPDRYRQSGSSNRAVERTHWSADGTLQDAPERPRLAPRTSHDGKQASWSARLLEEVRLGTVQDRYFQARHPQITARPAPCGAGSRPESLSKVRSQPPPGIRPVHANSVPARMPFCPYIRMVY